MTTTTGMQVMTLRASNNGTLIGNVDNELYNSESNTIATIPAGAIIRDIYINGVSMLTTGILFKIGVAGSPEWFVPASAGVTSDIINANSTCGYEPNGVRLPTANSFSVVVNPSDNCGGSLEIYLEYMIYSYLV